MENEELNKQVQEALINSGNTDTLQLYFKTLSKDNIKLDISDYHSHNNTDGNIECLILSHLETEPYYLIAVKIKPFCYWHAELRNKDNLPFPDSIMIIFNDYINQIPDSGATFNNFNNYWSSFRFEVKFNDHT